MDIYHLVYAIHDGENTGICGQRFLDREYDEFVTYTQTLPLINPRLCPKCRMIAKFMQQNVNLDKQPEV
jgi:hypothetical protein